MSGPITAGIPPLPSSSLYPSLRKPNPPTTPPAPQLAVKSVWQRRWDNVKYYTACAVSSLAPIPMCPDWSKNCVQRVTQYSQVVEFLHLLKTDTKKAIALLRTINPNTIYDGKTLLEHASEALKMDVVCELLKRGVQITPEQATDLLEDACKELSMDVVCELLKRGVQITPEQATELFRHACANEETQVVKALLERKLVIDPDLATDLLPLVVDWSPTPSKTEIIKALLIHGAVIDDDTKVKLEDYGILAELRKLYQGALKRNTLDDHFFVQAMVSNNCFDDIDFQRDIITVLKSKGPFRDKMVSLLIQAAKAKISLFEGVNRKELLQFAIDSENEVLLKEYCRYSNVKNPKHSKEPITTPALQQALQKGKLTSAVYLLEAGHTINPIDVTPQLLLRAVQLELKVAIATLLSKGADRFAKVQGKDALQQAYENPKCDRDVLTILTTYAFKGEGPKLVQNALAKGNFASAVLLLNSNPAAFILSKEDITPRFLLEAVKMQKTNAIRALLDRGVSMDAVIDGKSILQHALEMELVDSCAALLNHRSCRFPLHAICQYVKSDAIFLRLVRKNNPYNFVKDAQGRTPISILIGRKDLNKLGFYLSNIKPEEMSIEKVKELQQVILYLKALPVSDGRRTALLMYLTLYRGNIGAVLLEELLDGFNDFSELAQALANPLVMDASTISDQNKAIADRKNVVNFLVNSLNSQFFNMKGLRTKLEIAEKKYKALKRNSPDAAEKFLTAAKKEFFTGIAAIEVRVDKLLKLINDTKNCPFDAAQIVSINEYLEAILELRQTMELERIKEDYLYTLPTQGELRIPLHQNKKIVYDALTGGIVPDDEIEFSKHSLGDVESVKRMRIKQNASPVVVKQDGSFSYPAEDVATVHWTANFASQDIFQHGRDGSLAQGALQVAEHPGMLHLGAELQKRPGASRLEGNQVALIIGAKRYGSLAMSSDGFASASASTVRGNLGKFAVPTESKIFAMTAPQIGRDLAGKPYTKKHLEQMFLRAYTAFAAIKVEDDPKKKVVIHTGNAFGGNDRAAVFCQLAAARCAGIEEVHYYSQGQSAECQEAQRLLDILWNNPDTPDNMTVNDYLNWLVEHAETLNLRYKA